MSSQKSQDMEDDGVLEDIFGTTDYEAPKPAKKQFSPWHKPRKQFVRDRQWCKQINDLLKDGLPDGGVLKYLGLPGTDLLDLRYFHSIVCEPNDIDLRFLGFNTDAQVGSASQTELNISLDEVRKMSRIDPASEVIPDDFCAVANVRSLAWRRTLDHGPYNVVNLDLCDGFGKQAPGGLNNTQYDALSRIMTLQVRSKYPWLLFLTTRTGKQDVDSDVLARLMERYLSNLQECESFKQVSIDCLSIGSAQELELRSGSSEGHLEIFLAGLCKWIIGLSTSQQPPSKVEIKSTFGYQVRSDAEDDDLVSIALRFDPTFDLPIDPAGLATTSGVSVSECDLSTRAIKRLSKRKSVDAILGGDRNLLESMEDETAKLLVAARYDADAYHEWLHASD